MWDDQDFFYFWFFIFWFLFLCEKQDDQRLRLCFVVSFHPLQWQPFLNRKGRRRYFLFFWWTNTYIERRKKNQWPCGYTFMKGIYLLVDLIMFLLESQDVKLFSFVKLITEALSCKRAILSCSQQPKHPLKYNWTKIDIAKKQNVSTHLIFLFLNFRDKNKIKFSPNKVFFS